jgi:membrane protein
MKRLTLQKVKKFYIPFSALLKGFIVALKDFFFKDLPKAFKSFQVHDGELSTCALAFFLLISFIPVSLVIISAMSFFYESSDLAASIYLIQIKNQLPSINIDDFISYIDRIVYKKRYLAFVWLPFLFWWGSLVFDIVERALEIAFRIDESRKYWKAKIRHFIIIIGISLTVISLTLLSNFFIIIKQSSVAGFIDKYLKDLVIFKTKLTSLVELPLLLSSAATLFINTLLISILYKYVPPRKLDNISMLKGALFASLSYEIVKILFSFYITEINDYTSIFGSLSAIVILMIWIWYTCFLFVFGAELSWVFHEKKRVRH